MAIAYSSIAIATATETADNALNITITKPSGVAVGDYMLAIIGYADIVESQFFELSGWSNLRQGHATDNVLSVMGKIATSADVAASDFTFTKTAGDEAEAVCGAILRITGNAFGSATANLIASDADASADQSPTYSGGVTPRRANNLFVMGATSGSAAAVTASGYAVATDNPTWTERADFNVTDGGGVDCGLHIATATRSATTATGNYSLSFSSDPGDSIGFIFVFDEDLFVPRGTFI